MAGPSITWFSPSIFISFHYINGRCFLGSPRKDCFICSTTLKDDFIVNGLVCMGILQLMEDDSIELSGMPIQSFFKFYNFDLSLWLETKFYNIYLMATKQFVQTRKKSSSAKSSHLRWSVITDMHASLFLRGFQTHGIVLVTTLLHWESGRWRMENVFH